MQAKEHEQVDKVDHDADEWKVCEIAKDAVKLLKENEYEKWRKE